MEKTLKRCPACGTKLNGEDKNNELLHELNELKERGILQQTMFVAVKIVQTMSDSNFAWLKRALDEQGNRLEDSLQKKIGEQIRPVLESISGILGNPLKMGALQEEAITNRLSSLKTGSVDRFNTEQSRRSQEDIACTVVENGVEIGKIVIESKRTKDWQEAYIEQIKQYMERKNTEFGILVTTALPDDALNNTVWRNGVLVVKPSYIEQAYIFMREFLIAKRALQQEYSTKISQLEVRDQILEELKKAIASGELDVIIESMNAATLGIDSTILKAESYLARMFRDIKKDTGTIRKLASRLVSEHIEKIRTQLFQGHMQVLGAKSLKQ